MLRLRWPSRIARGRSSEAAVHYSGVRMLRDTRSVKAAPVASRVVRVGSPSSSLRRATREGSCQRAIACDVGVQCLDESLTGNWRVCEKNMVLRQGNRARSRTLARRVRALTLKHGIGAGFVSRKKHATDEGTHTQQQPARTHTSGTLTRQEKTSGDRRLPNRRSRSV